MPTAATGGGGKAPLGKRGAWAGLQHRIGTQVPHYLKRSEKFRLQAKRLRYKRVGGR